MGDRKLFQEGRLASSELYVPRGCAVILIECNLTQKGKWMNMGQHDKSNSLGKFISYILRHHPETVGIEVDEHGWADTEDLINGIAKTRNFNMQMLEEIVRTDSKQRYSFNEDKTLIRANQGHSIPVDVELEQKNPPEILWHGTAEKYVESINQIGLIRKSRLYVHLSKDYETAKTVGSRHGKPSVYQVNAKKMAADGYPFYLSVNGVWLTKEVSVRYLSIPGIPQHKQHSL